MKAQPHVSVQLFLQNLVLFSAVIIDGNRDSLLCGSHRIAMGHENSLENFQSDVPLERTVSCAMFRHMLFSIFIQPGSQLDPEP